MKKYNWGMIGTGWIAHEMADAINDVNGQIYAVADVNETMLNKFAAEKHIAKTFTDADAMIKSLMLTTSVLTLLTLLTVVQLDNLNMKHSVLQV